MREEDSATQTKTVAKCALDKVCESDSTVEPLPLTFGELLPLAARLRQRHAGEDQ